MHERKAQRMAKGYTKVKNENENLYEANKKPWTQIKSSKIEQFFGIHRKEGESSQKGFNHWQRQAEESQEKAAYWERKNFSTFEKLTKCLNDKKEWKMRAEAKEIKYQKVLEEKITSQNATQVLKHRLLQQKNRINRVLEDWQNNDEH